jgi:hypothetical protein
MPEEKYPNFEKSAFESPIYYKAKRVNVILSPSSARTDQILF